VLAALRTPGFLARVRRLVPDVLRHIKAEDFALEAQFGLDDPAETGQLYGALSPLLVGAALGHWRIRCQPSFVGAGFEGSCKATLRARPLPLLWVGLMFLASPVVLRAIRSWRSHR